MALWIGNIWQVVCKIAKKIKLICVFIGIELQPLPFFYPFHFCTFISSAVPWYLTIPAIASGWMDVLSITAVADAGESVLSQFETNGPQMDWMTTTTMKKRLGPVQQSHLYLNICIIFGNWNRIIFQTLWLLDDGIIQYMSMYCEYISTYDPKNLRSRKYRLGMKDLLNMKWKCDYYSLIFDWIRKYIKLFP